jgi:site-specific DNA-methyltransferase (adenine-specific)
MRKEIIGDCALYHDSMENVIQSLDTVDHIFSDPPYLYIKTHDFDRKFDEKLLFENAKRVLPDSGFIALFGRGTSFYRWNTRLAELGFVFKEEIIWDKRQCTSPCMALSRVHETVSIHTKSNGKIRLARVPYIEQKQFDLESIVNDIKRIKSAIGSEAGLNKIIKYLQSGELYTEEYTHKACITQRLGIKSSDRANGTLAMIENGMKEKSIMYTEKINTSNGLTVSAMPQKDRAIKTIESIESMREKSIITQIGNHYHAVHPTEKPVRLAERIIALISDPGDTIYDPFMGSGSFGIACLNAGRKYIGSEINPAYFKVACKHIEQAYRQPALTEAAYG